MPMGNFTSDKAAVQSDVREKMQAEFQVIVA